MIGCSRADAQGIAQIWVVSTALGIGVADIAGHGPNGKAEAKVEAKHLTAGLLKQAIGKERK